MKTEDLLKVRYYVTNGIRQLELIDECLNKDLYYSLSFNVFYWCKILNMIRDLLLNDYKEDAETDITFRNNLSEINREIQSVLDEDKVPFNIIEYLKETQKNCLLAKELI